jgi:isocitrate dehydrogenase
MHKANEEFLSKNKSPSRKCGEIDNRGSHFYLIKYFSDALALQTQDKDLAEEFVEISKNLNENEDLIINELNQVQGVSADIGGYYHPHPELADKIMRPSVTLNKLFK